MTWTLVLPVQHADRGKTRLTAPSGVRRADLARAFATDALTAVLASASVGRVVLVTSDPVLRERAAEQGADVVADPGSGLTAAVQAGIDAAREAAPGAPLGVLLPDVPALRPADLDAALVAAADHELALVPDLEGTGSVLLAAARGGALPHAFGDGSAARHVAAGAVRLDLD
ncbi:2-phospho-L-lactate guanylyltransferase, partial [Angustibacter peucedani]